MNLVFLNVEVMSIRWIHSANQILEIVSVEKRRQLSDCYVFKLHLCTTNYFFDTFAGIIGTNGI